MASIIDVLIIVNPDLTIRSINAVGLEALGYTLEELDERNLGILFNNESVFSEDEYRQILTHGSVNNLEKNIRLKNGEIRPALFSVSVMNDRGGNVSAFICTARDITERKIAEKKLKGHTAELEKINKELDQFAYITSHDLKAPLRAIANISEWIEEDLGSDNAIKYHDKESGKITLGHKKLENVHEFSVADDGPGIPPEYHEKIFVIFQTLEARDKIESTGVGLSIVKKIIEENGGAIKVEPVPAQGARFIFTWPE